MRSTTSRFVVTASHQQLKNSSVLSRTACASLLLATMPVAAYALPEGGTVVGGSADINYGATQVTVNQNSNNAVINWTGFNILGGESTVFNQLSSNSIVLNRITSGNATQILGTLSANGRVMIVNPNGVIFGAGAQVNVGSLVATTADISNDDFMAGHMNFNTPGNADASIINHGHITAAQGGLVALVAPHVVNDGVIQATMGTVALGAAQTVSIDFYGDNLYGFALGQATGAAGAGVTNAGTIQAQKVVLSAKVAGDVLDNVVNNTGIIQATSAHVGQGGVIILDGGSNGNVNVAGTVNASGVDNVGSVTIAGKNITLGGDINGDSVASVNATGNITATGANVRADHGDVVFNSVDLTLLGSAISASGNLILDNDGVFFSDTADVLNANHVYLQQSKDGSIQNAIDAISGDAGSSELKLGAGEFTNQTVTINGMHDFTLRGSGIAGSQTTGTAIRMRGERGQIDANYILSILNSDGITIDNILFNDARLDSTMGGVLIRDSAGVTLKKSRVFVRGTGVRIDDGSVAITLDDNYLFTGPAGNAIEIEDSNLINIKDSTILTGGIGIKANGVNGIDITNNLIGNVGSAAISLSYGNDVNIASNRIYNNNESGIVLDTIDRAFVSNNDIEALNGDGVKATNVNQFTADNNKIYAGHDGIALQDVFQAQIESNNISAGYDGIDFNNVTIGTIENNSILAGINGVTITGAGDIERGGEEGEGPFYNVVVQGNNIYAGVNGIEVNTTSDVLMQNNSVLADNFGINIIDSSSIDAFGNDITAFGHGVNISGSMAVSIDDNFIDSFNSGIYANGVNYLYVGDNTIYANEDGIYANGYDIDISDNHIVSSGDGVHVAYSDEVMVDGNTIDIGIMGVHLDNVSNATVKDNTINGGSEAGISLTDSHGAYLSNNTVTNSAIGVLLQNSDNVFLDGGLFTNNAIGVKLDHSHSASLYNLVLNNNGTGFEITNESSDTAISGATITGGDVAFMIGGGDWGSSMYFTGDASYISGQNYYFILENGAVGSTFSNALSAGSYIDASGQYFEGVMGNNFNASQEAAANARTIDYNVDPDLSDVVYVKGGELRQTNHPRLVPSIAAIIDSPDFTDNTQEETTQGGATVLGADEGSHITYNISLDKVIGGSFQNGDTGALDTTDTGNPATQDLASLSPSAGGNTGNGNSNGLFSCDDSFPANSINCAAQ